MVKETDVDRWKGVKGKGVMLSEGFVGMWWRLDGRGVEREC